MSEKVVSNVSVTGKSDSSTSYFSVVASKQPITIKQKIRECINNIRKSMVEMTIKATAHSIDEVGNYLKNVYGFVEINKNSDEFQTEYKNMRASYIMVYAPELLGTLASYPELAGEDTKDMKK